jgi:hypothetical protein
MTSGERCPRSGKVMYATKQKAWAALEDIKRKANRRGGEGRPSRKKRPPASSGNPGAYKCEHCKQYHTATFTGERP